MKAFTDSYVPAHTHEIQLAFLPHNDIRKHRLKSTKLSMKSFLRQAVILLSPQSGAMYHDVRGSEERRRQCLPVAFMAPKGHLNHLPLFESFFMTPMNDANPHISKNITQLKINILDSLL